MRCSYTSTRTALASTALDRRAWFCLILFMSTPGARPAPIRWAQPAGALRDRSCRRKVQQLRLLQLEAAPSSWSAELSNYRHRSRGLSGHRRAPQSVRTHRREVDPLPSHHARSGNDKHHQREDEPGPADYSQQRSKVWHAPPTTTASPSSQTGSTVHRVAGSRIASLVPVVYINLSLHER